MWWLCRFVCGVLKRILPDDKANSIEGLTLTADGQAAVFDVAQSDVDQFIAAARKNASVSLEVVKELPKLQEREPAQRRFGRPGGGGQGFNNRGRGGSRFGRGGGRGGGQRW